MMFEGFWEDKEYLYLEEYLIWLIFVLDLINVDGFENVKFVCKLVVKEILNIIIDLEVCVSVWNKLVYYMCLL